MPTRSWLAFLAGLAAATLAQDGFCCGTAATTTDGSSARPHGAERCGETAATCSTGQRPRCSIMAALTALRRLFRDGEAGAGGTALESAAGEERGTKGSACTAAAGSGESGCGRGDAAARAVRAGEAATGAGSASGDSGSSGSDRMAETEAAPTNGVAAEEPTAERESTAAALGVAGASATAGAGVAALAATGDGGGGLAAGD